MALYEGDAMATMTAVAARRAQRPVKLALGAAATAMRSLTAAQIVQASGYSPELLQAPAVVREELATPYVAGLALVAEGPRLGGGRVHAGARAARFHRARLEHRLGGRRRAQLRQSDRDAGALLAGGRAAAARGQLHHLRRGGGPGGRREGGPGARPVAGGAGT